MWKLIAFLQKHLVWTIPASMILGVLYGYYYDPSLLKGSILPLTFLMVYPMMVNLNIKEVFSGGDMRVQVVTQALNFLVIPFIGFAIGRYFFPDQPLIILGLLLTGLLPTSGMTISWTGFAKGNISAAIKMTVVGLILGSLATPFYLKWLMGTVVTIPLGDIFQQIILIVFIPMVAGYATQRLIIWKFGKEQYQKVYKPRFPAISTLGVLGIVFTAMALKSKTITSTPMILLELLLPLVIIYGLNFALSTIVAKVMFKRNDAIALVYGTVMRNLSIALAIAMTAFGRDGSEIALIIAVAYIIQVQAAAWYVRFTDRIFGASPAAVPPKPVKAEMPKDIPTLDQVFTLATRLSVADKLGLIGRLVPQIAEVVPATAVPATVNEPARADEVVLTKQDDLTAGVPARGPVAQGGAEVV